MLKYFIGHLALVLGHTTAFSTLRVTERSLIRLQSSNPIGGFMRKTFAGLTGLSKDLTVDISSFEDPAVHGLTWEFVKTQLHASQTPSERNFRADLSAGTGPNNAKANLRLFDAPEGTEPRITFYRDSASWCPYCHKVWLCLEERRLPYKVERVNMSCYGDKPASFRRLQPSGQIPVCVIDGQVYGQSNEIIDALERFTVDYGGVDADKNKNKNPSLYPPAGSKLASQVAPLLRLERQFFGAWLQWLCGGSGARLKFEFETVLGEVESALAASSEQGPYFLGASFTVVDAMFAPFLERAAGSLVYFKGYRFRGGKTAAGEGPRGRWPHVNAWFDAMESRPSYRATMSDFYTHAHDLPPQLGGCPSDPAAKPFADALDGLEQSNGLGLGAWRLDSLSEESEESEALTGEPAWNWVEPSMAKREACERLAENSQAVARFAARGAGRAGVPAVRASLADPNAVSCEDVVPVVDACLRVVALHLLQTGAQTTDQAQSLAGGGGGGGGGSGAGVPKEEEAEAAEALAGISADDLLASLVSRSDGPSKAAVAASLHYLRDRVGVPRDMSLPAAQHFRARLNWAADAMLK